MPLHFREYKITQHFLWHLKNSTTNWTLEVRREIDDIILFGPKNNLNSCEACSIFAYDRETPPLGDCPFLFSVLSAHPSSKLIMGLTTIFHGYGG